MEFTPGAVARLTDQRTQGDLSRVGGRGGGGGAEIGAVGRLPQRILLVGFLSSTQNRHHLASWNAPEQEGGGGSGVNAASYADGGMGQS